MKRSPHPKDLSKVTERRERRDQSFMRHLRRRISDLFPLVFPVIGWIITAWRWTLHRTVRFDRRGPLFEYIRDGKPFIFTCWHEDVFPTMFEVSRNFAEGRDNLFMVSPGRTGAIGSYFLNLFHVGTIAGSGSHKGRKAITKLTNEYRKSPCSIYILADGSRGPHHEMRWGALYLARDTGLPVIAGRAWSRHLVCLWWTWMKLALPLPWGRSVFLSSEPLYVPGEATKEELQQYREALQRRLDDLSETSVAWLRNPDVVEKYGASFGEFPELPVMAAAELEASET